MNKIENEIMSNADLSINEEDVVLKVEGLSKKFCRTLKRSMYYGTMDIARSMMGINYDTDKLRKTEFWALNDVSFELKKGETLGIIGENGSGKSTLLRLITGIFPPDKGRISFKGRIGALIAVGAGFHPHMTGKENIYLNGTLLGMTRRELNERLNEIIDFAEIGDFLDSPVSTYSSGMRVRLGFAIAVHCEPDILLVDEVLSVGDINFKNKCIRKMAALRKRTSILFISHDMYQIDSICSRVLLLENGKIVANSSSEDVITQYYNRSLYQNVIKNIDTNVAEVIDKITNVKLSVLNEEKTEQDIYNTGDNIIFRISFESAIGLGYIVVGIGIRTTEGTLIINQRSNNNKECYFINKGYNEFNFCIKNIPLLKGHYSTLVHVKSRLNNRLIVAYGPQFIIAANNKYNDDLGIVRVNTKWC